MTPERVPVWWREGKKKVKGPLSSERHKDEFSKIEVRGVGDFLLTFSFSSQPDFSLTFFFLSPRTPLNMYSLKIEVEVALTCLLVES